jgi:heterodisulfide reductase subunit A-like polyferredoxin
VVDGLIVERPLPPTGPCGPVLRPSDGKEPTSFADVQCAGSRDQTLGVEYCSRICCMYAIKPAMLLSGALPLAEVTIYYMGIRTFGKAYEQFHPNAKAMGIEFIKGKVAKITGEALRQFRAVPGVVNADMTFGPFGVIAIIQTDSVDAPGHMVAWQLQPIVGVNETVTCLAVEPNGR